MRRPPWVLAAVHEAGHIIYLQCQLLSIMSLTSLSAGTVAVAAPQRLLVAYVGQHSPTAERQQRVIRRSWEGMQTEYPRWSLRCLLATGGRTDQSLVVHGPEKCSELSLSTPSEGELRVGYTVHRLLLWLGSRQQAVPRFDFLLKADLSTVVCFSMITDLLEAVQLRFRTPAAVTSGDEASEGSRVYLGQIQTCARVSHAGLVRRGDELHDAPFLDDVLRRKDAVCFPPHMQGLGYVLGAQLVQEIAAMGARGTLQIYDNEDVMVGTWLLGHRVHRARLVAKEYLVRAQTTPSW